MEHLIKLLLEYTKRPFFRYLLQKKIYYGSSVDLSYDAKIVTVVSIAVKIMMNDEYMKMIFSRDRVPTFIDILLTAVEILYKNTVDISFLMEKIIKDKCLTNMIESISSLKENYTDEMQQEEMQFGVIQHVTNKLSDVELGVIIKDTSFTLVNDITNLSSVLGVSVDDTVDLLNNLLKDYAPTEVIAQLRRLVRYIGKSNTFYDYSITERLLDRRELYYDNRIDKLVVDEYVKLAHPKLKQLARLEFIERQMLCYRRVYRGKGPVVFVIDRSGSMARIWEKVQGLLLVFVKHLIEQKRPFCFIFFNNKMDKGVWHDYKTSYVFDVRKEAYKEVLSVCPKGGTLLEYPLRAALNDETYRNADVFVITDALFTPSDTTDCIKLILKYREHRRVFMLRIDGGAYDALEFSRLTPYLTAFKVITPRDLSKDVVIEWCWNNIKNF